MFSIAIIAILAIKNVVLAIENENLLKFCIQDFHISVVNLLIVLYKLIKVSTLLPMNKIENNLKINCEYKKLKFYFFHSS